MKHLNNSSDKEVTKINRRRFLIGSLATGALALGGILLGKKDLLAESVENLGGLRWQITIDGKVVKEGLVPLTSKEELLLPVPNGTARIVMDHGRIYMPEDNNICPKKICSLMGSITKSGESITCLPNKLVIRIL
ncbi:MAG TPA: NusG domain II-containing protein [Peptococcaceae bacterium]|nr:NusG domain II-containing protein [Peptococcaceae bacterium]